MFSNKPHIFKSCVFYLLIAFMVSCSQEGNNSTTNVGISGNTFTLNGVPWIPKAFNIAGFVSTPAFLSQLNSQAKFNGYIADTMCGPELFTAVKRWGADTVRIMVSQYFLNPISENDPFYDPNYYNEVVSIISQARDNGLVVIISMQDEEEGGGPRFHGLPTKETLENWIMLNEIFGGDQGVMYELYNEPTQGKPNEKPSPEDWMLWLNGGTAYFPPDMTDPFTAVGMQTIINELRSAGSINTFILDGLGLATTLNGLNELPTPVTDPLNRVGYGIHQYLKEGTVTQSDWETNFGQFSDELPIFVDEWFACANTKPGILGLDSYQLVVDFLNYLQTRGIGIGGWAIDVPGYMVNDIPTPDNCSAGWQHPSYYDGYNPLTMPIGDAGMLIINDFLSDYGRMLTIEDGTKLYQEPSPTYPAIPCST